MPNIEWDDNDSPLAYFITFRTHGSWLHGDERGSVERHGRNIYGSPRIDLDPTFSVMMERNLETAAVALDAECRAKVVLAIRDVCSIREYSLLAINVRTNHVHAVVSAPSSPKTLMSAFKANATRELREARLFGAAKPVWSCGGSTRYLWKERNVEAAVDYTVNGQGSELPEF